MNKNLTVLLVSLSVFAQTVSIAIDCCAQASAEAQGPWTYSVPPPWLSVPWISQTGPDLSAYIDKLGEKDKITDKIIDFYAKVAAKDPGSLAAQAEYAEVLCQANENSMDVARDIAQFLPAQMLRKGPVTREYARSIFVCYATVDQEGPPWMRQLGARLLASDPDDYEVMAGVTGVSQPELSDKTTTYDLELVERMKKLRPGEAGPYGAAFDIYQDRELALCDIPDVKAAITALKMFDKLETTPASKVGDPMLMQALQGMLSDLEHPAPKPTSSSEVSK